MSYSDSIKPEAPALQPLFEAIERAVLIFGPEQAAEMCDWLSLSLATAARRPVSVARARDQGVFLDELRQASRYVMRCGQELRRTN